MCSGKGHIYILSNPSLKSNCLKIGLTKIDVSKRAHELSRSTAIPSPFGVKDKFPVENALIAERRIHLMLDDYRIAKSKEFFSIPLCTAKNICRYVADYEQEDDRLDPEIYLHNDLLAAHYHPKVTLRFRKLIYVLISATTNNTNIDRLFENRRGIVDGFLRRDYLAKQWSISQRAASDAMRKFADIGSEISCHPIDANPIHSIFEFVRYHKGHLAWKFSSEYRKQFYNSKL